jgi:hypothetical protein
MAFGALRSRQVGRSTVKTRTAERLVPLLPELKRLGFIEHMQQLQGEGIVRLFPDIEPGAGGYLSDTISKWFGRLLRLTLGKAAIGADGLMFHSFRHREGCPSGGRRRRPR